MGSRFGLLAAAAGMGAEALMARDNVIDDALETQMPHGIAVLGGGTLHEAADQVEGDHAHPKGLVRHLGTFHGEVLHAEGGFEVAQFEFDVPPPGIQIGKLDAAMLLGIEQGGDDNQLALPAVPVPMAELDQAHLERGGQCAPFLAAKGGSRRTLRA